MTHYQANIGFGLPKERRGSDSAEIESWLSRVGLGGLGGIATRTSFRAGSNSAPRLARAMAPGPQVLLMDEPFASVDIVLRRALRRECRMLLREQRDDDHYRHARSRKRRWISAIGSR